MGRVQLQCDISRLGELDANACDSLVGSGEGVIDRLVQRRGNFNSCLRLKSNMLQHEPVST